jgi:hypothetical protein
MGSHAAQNLHSHPLADRGEYFNTAPIMADSPENLRGDEMIRFFGYKLYSRQNNREPVWVDKKTGVKLTQSQVLKIIKLKKTQLSI